MKTRLFQQEVTPGQPQLNTQVMLEAVAEAKKDGVSLIIFPEMAIPGYLLSDEWEKPAFIRACEQCNQALKKASDGITLVFGSLAVDWAKTNEDGRPRKYNALFVAEDGQFVPHPITGQDFFIKLLMPNYREFDDNRHFHDPRKLAHELNLRPEDLVHPVPSKLGLLGCILCEDGWDEDYSLSPLRILAAKQAQLFINISSSPYTFDKNLKRERVFSTHAIRHNKPVFYVNCCGLQDNGKTLFTFDGGTCAYSADGTRLAHARAFEQMALDLACDLASPHTHSIKHSLPATLKTDGIEQQYQALRYGIKTFMARIGLKKVVVGVSGGIDSAVAAALYRSILSADDMLLVSMPGPFTSETTKHLARHLAQKLDCYFTEIPIAPSVAVTQNQLNNALFTHPKAENKQLTVSNFVLENIQARDRSSRVLAGVAAAFGGAFTCNANKAEMTVGYSTLYGDLGGFLAALADLWKGEVYDLARFLNREIFCDTVIPQGSIDIVPSAELSNAQDVDKNQGDPLIYPYHDGLFKSWVEHWQRATPEDNLQWYLDGTLAQKLGYHGDINALFPTAEQFIVDLERWWNLYQGMAVTKRIQAPPVLAVKRRAFGFDHRESQLGPRYTEAYQALKARALSTS